MELTESVTLASSAIASSFPAKATGAVTSQSIITKVNSQYPGPRRKGEKLREKTRINYTQ